MGATWSASAASTVRRPGSRPATKSTSSSSSIPRRGPSSCLRTSPLRSTPSPPHGPRSTGSRTATRATTSRSSPAQRRTRRGSGGSKRRSRRCARASPASRSTRSLHAESGGCRRDDATLPPGGPASGDLAEPARLNLVDEAVDRHVLDPRVGPDPADLLAQVVLEVRERVEGEVDVGAGLRDEIAVDVVVLEREHPAAGVLDHDDLFGAEEVLADDER